MVSSRYNRYPVSGKQSRYHMKTFHQTTRSMLYIFWNICKIFFKLCNTIPGPNVEWYSGTCIRSPLGPDQLAVLQRWPAYTVYIESSSFYTYIHDIVYVYVRDSSSSNSGFLLRVIDKFYQEYILSPKDNVFFCISQLFPAYTSLEVSGND